MKIALFRIIVIPLGFLMLITGCAERRSNTTSEFDTIEEEISFYIGKLEDQSFTSTYGHGYTWYTAAEELGRIGKPAIPHLIRKLESNDPYELKLALYALALASQDIRIRSETKGEYVKLLAPVLSAGQGTNKINIRIALEWWEKYKHIWEVKQDNHNPVAP